MILDSKHEYNAIPIPPTPQTLNTTYMVCPLASKKCVNVCDQFCMWRDLIHYKFEALILLLVSNILLAHYHGFWNGFYGFLGGYFTTKTFYLKLKIYTTRVEFQISWNIWHKWELLRFKWKWSQISINSPDVLTTTGNKWNKNTELRWKSKYWDYLKVSVCN